MWPRSQQNRVAAARAVVERRSAAGPAGSRRVRRSRAASSSSGCVTGPVFHYSDTWQLVINTGTTIVTFLMVFLIQRSQNKESLAVQLKLNELVAAMDGASNRLIDVEDLTEEELRALHRYYAQARGDVAEGRQPDPVALGRGGAGPARPQARAAAARRSRRRAPAGRSPALKRRQERAGRFPGSVAPFVTAVEQHRPHVHAPRFRPRTSGRIRLRVPLVALAAHDQDRWKRSEVSASSSGGSRRRRQ